MPEPQNIPQHARVYTRISEVLELIRKMVKDFWGSNVFTKPSSETAKTAQSPDSAVFACATPMRFAASFLTLPDDTPPFSAPASSPQPRRLVLSMLGAPIVTKQGNDLIRNVMAVLCCVQVQERHGPVFSSAGAADTTTA